jgi:D-alanyl-D-alanine carboxypeptidase (penicillin-binding protein 5/6)
VDAVGESSARLVPGETLTLRDLLVGLLTGSGNDAGQAIAVALAGGEPRFVALMNRAARRLGLTRTRFANPHGLDEPGHFSTARDLVRLGRAAYARPVIREITAERTGTIPGPFGRGLREFESENDLLDIEPEADGIKTGQTSGAGYALVTHARRPGNGGEVFAAIIGAPSRDARAVEARRLLRYGLAQFSRATLIGRDRVVARVGVRRRPGVAVELTVRRPLTASLRLGRPLSETLTAPSQLVAPLRAGQVVGSVVVREGRRVVGRRDVVVARDVAAPSLLERLRAGWGNLT